MNNNLEITNSQTKEITKPQETHNNNTSNTNLKDQVIEDNIIQTTNTYNNILNKNSNSKHNKTKHNSANDSFEKLILTLKDKIQKNKTPYTLTKHNNTSFPNKHTSPLPLSNSIKIKQLLSIITPLEQCSSPKLSPHQQQETTQQSILKPHYNNFKSNNNHQPKPKHKVTPRTSLIKPKKVTFQNKIPNHIIPLISNSFSPKFVTAQDKRYKIFYTSSRNKSHNEHTFHSTTTSNPNIDTTNTYNSERARHSTIVSHYNKDSLLKELESFDNKLFGVSTKEVSSNRKKRSETQLIISSDYNNNFYKCYNIKPQVQNTKFNRLKLNI